MQYALMRDVPMSKHPDSSFGYFLIKCYFDGIQKYLRKLYVSFQVRFMKKVTTSEQLFEHLLEILCEFDRVCNEAGIRYSLYGGTLLGAVREHGFIPWDDDVDVFMTRENFKRLEQVLNNLNSDYYIKGKIKKQFCHTGNTNIWIDIFVCDYISDNCVCKKLKQCLLSALDAMYRDQTSIKLSNLSRHNLMKRLSYKTAFAVGNIVPKNWTATLYTCISEKCFRGHRRTMFRSNDQYTGRSMSFPAEWMKKHKKIDFAGKSFWIIEECDRLLVQCYGPDYMIPVRYKRNAEIHDLVRTEQEITL